MWSGILPVGLLYYIIRLDRNKSETGHYYKDLYLFKDTGFQWKLFFLMVYLLLNQILNEAAILWNFEIATGAKINIGVLSAIWSTCPLIIALLEFIIFRTKIAKANIFAFFALVAGTVCVSFSTAIEE